MLRIRPEQFRAFEQAALLQFEDDMVAHLEAFAPKLFEVRGEPSFRELIRLGIFRAMGHGFTNRGPIRFYLETMVSLGSEFDSDPQLPGVAETLENPDELDQMTLADQLFEVVSDFVKETKGPDNRYAIAALRHLVEHDVFSRPVPAENVRRAVAGMLRLAYPEKCDYMGTKRLQRLVDDGTAQARKHDIGSPEGRAMMTALMFAMGHGVARDPMYPWVGKTLADPKYSQPDQRVKFLRRKSQLYLEATLQHLAA